MRFRSAQLQLCSRDRDDGPQEARIGAWVSLISGPPSPGHDFVVCRRAADAIAQRRPAGPAAGVAADRRGPLLAEPCAWHSVTQRGLSRSPPWAAPGRAGRSTA